MSRRVPTAFDIVKLGEYWDVDESQTRWCMGHPIEFNTCGVVYGKCVKSIRCDDAIINRYCCKLPVLTQDESLARFVSLSSLIHSSLSKRLLRLLSHKGQRAVLITSNHATDDHLSELKCFVERNSYLKCSFLSLNALEIEQWSTCEWNDLFERSHVTVMPLSLFIFAIERHLIDPDILTAILIDDASAIFEFHKNKDDFFKRV
ncbi:hypothetical protein ACOME3_002204 [Neoechinorhynchus agilis]